MADAAEPADAQRDLIRAMRRLASERTPAARTRMYHCLMAAPLLVPLRDDEVGPPCDAEGFAIVDPSLAGTFAVLESLAGESVFGAFVEVDALHRLRPGSASARLRGWQLFPLLAPLRPASLVLNRGGSAGGELYRHEIEMLAEAAHRWRATAADA